MHGLLWLLLPVAALSGWGAARLHYARQTPTTSRAYHPGYLRGLNYLVNEEPDKALDAFIQVLEVDTDTVETHLALGGLFRRRGEIDRAIRIHENLIDQPRLTSDQLAAAHRELARDYMRAGLLDRAENLLQTLVDTSPDHIAELGYLLEIYQQEKEWEKARVTAERLDEANGQDARVLCAHFCCELAEELVCDGDLNAAMDLIKRAEDYDSNCVRTSILTGRLAQAKGDHQAAISAYERVARQDIAYVPAILARLRECYLQSGSLQSMKSFLKKISRQSATSPVTMALVDVINETENAAAAEKVLLDHIAGHPTLAGIGKLMDISEGIRPNERFVLNEILRDTIFTLSRLVPLYRCKRCGFEGQTIHWRCPGCKSWGLVKPVDETAA